MLLNNQRELEERRRNLRSSATPQEVIIWSRLRKNQLGHKFRRQHGIGWYIIDFYCPKRKLAIEIDGSHHIEEQEYDAERTRYLNSLGITVLRFWDNEVTTDIEGVISKIITVLSQ